MTALPAWDDPEDTAPEEGGPDADLLAQLTNWDEFWDVDHDATDWLLEPLIAGGRGHALFAPGGEGKSLLVFWIVVQAVTGGAAFGNHPREPIDVLYLDYEMTPADLAERLENQGIGPETDLSRLHYAQLPSLPPLDTPEGGKALVRLAELVDAKLVVIDTNTRAVGGDENDADTVRAFYRWTGIHLKADGRAFLRIDHAGKDADRGQRGSSAKNDDVDIVWKLTRADGGVFTLKTLKRRMGWVPQEITVTLSDDPVRYTLTAGGGYPAGTKELAEKLDRLGVPVNASQRGAGRLLREGGYAAKNAPLRAAIKYRKEEEMRLLMPVDKSPLTCGQTRPFLRGAPTPTSAPLGVGRENENPSVDTLGRGRGAAGRGVQSHWGAPPLSQSGAPQDQPPEAPESDTPSHADVGLDFP